MGAGLRDREGEIATGVEVTGSTFARIHDSSPLSGAGIVAWDCVRNLDVRDSRFDRSSGGIAIARHLRRPAGSVRISSNVFSSLEASGVELNRAVRVDALTDNELLQVSAPSTLAAPAAAVRLRSVDGEYATVRARGNKIIESDIGIEVLGAPAERGHGAAAARRGQA